MELKDNQKEINDNLVKLGAINSGSYSLNRQGNLTRESVNDLDYFLPYQIKDDFIKNVVKKYPQAIFSEPYSGVLGNRSLTLSLKIDDVKIDFFLPTSQEESDKNKIIVIDGVKHHHWKNIFDAKVRIGSQKHLSDLAGFTPFNREWSVYNVNWRDPLVLKDDYLNIVGQRHYNFDFIQSKYNSKEYSSGEQVVQSDNIKTYWDKNLEQTAVNYFKDNNIDFEKSIQYQNLLSYFGNKKNKAITAYYLTFSENFKKFYGNIDSRKNLPSFIINSIRGNYSKNSILLDEYGDPLIFYHGAGTMFDKFSKDYFLSGEGAMAYGAGFYSTNYKPTADNYRDTAKAAMETFRKLLEEQNKELLELMEKLKIDINENILINFMSGSFTVDDTKSKTELLNLLGLTETKALYIALTNPLYWQNDISKENKNLIESRFGIKLENNNSGRIYRELQKTLKISDKELSARLYQIGIDGVINIAGGGQAVGGFSHKRGETHVVFFEPIQAKAVNNSGLFSLNNENMYDPIEVKENSITSKVVPTNPNMVDNSERQDSKVGSAETNQIITESLNKLNIHLENYLNQFGFNTEQLDDLKQLTGYSEYNKNDESSNNLQSTESILETNPKLKKFIEDITDEDGSISLFKYNKIINDKEKFGNLPVMKTITKLNNILKNAVNRLWDNRINAENNLKIKFVESLEDEDAVAQFLRKENEIHISKNIFLNILDKDFKDYPEFYTGYLLNHELIHYLTPQSLSTKPQFIDRLLLNEKSDMYLKNLYEREFVKNIKNLYNFSISQLEDLSDYGFTNLAEFVTEAMSNPRFQVKLSTIKYKNENKSLWKKFIKILSDYLSSITGNSIEDTVLEAVISEVTNYITENSNIERTYKTKINNSGDTQFYFVFNKNSEIGIEQEEINNYDNSDNENFEFNEDLTGNEYIENIDNKYLIKFEKLLNKGVITQVCN